MGNSPSSDQKQLYESYINQQFKTIQSQQQQINQLIANMQNNSQQNNPQQNNIIKSKLEKLIRLNRLEKQKYIEKIQAIKKAQQTNDFTNLPKIENKLDPYKILDLNKNYDKKSLKQAYIKKAAIAHPDRGGSDEEFQKVSIAYTVLLKKLDEKQEKSHDQLKQSYKNNVDSGYKKIDKQFDVDVFNKIYQENKIDDIYDAGYGDWFKKESENKQKLNMLNKKFNKDMFNSEFESYKRQNKNSQSLVVKNPEVSISYKGADSIVELGKKSVKNFSGESGGLSYRDLRDAYENPTLIDTTSVDVSNRLKDYHQLKSSRKNVEYKMSKQQLQDLHREQLKQQENEKQRLQRLKKSDEQIFNNYQKIHNRLVN
jgi:curved DNA-binding protein CbpA